MKTKMKTKYIILSGFLFFILVFSVTVAEAVLPSYKINTMDIEGADSDGKPSSHEYSIRGIRIWLKGAIDKMNDEELGNLVVRRSSGTEIIIRRGSLTDPQPYHELKGTTGTVVNSNSEVITNNIGEFYLSFILPFNAVGTANDTLYVFFTKTADGVYNRVRDGTNQFVKFDVQVPRYSDADVYDMVYKNGNTIQVDLELETDPLWPGMSAGRGIEVLTLLPDFSNVDSMFAGGNSRDAQGNLLVPIGKVPNTITGRYDLSKWDPGNTNPNALDLYDLFLDVDRAIAEARMTVIDDGGGDYEILYTISADNLNEPGRKRMFVYALDYPSVLNKYNMRDIFIKTGLPFPGALNMAVWKTTDDLDFPPDGMPDTEDINLDNRAPNFDFAVINPFVNPPHANWIDVDGDGVVDSDEWVYVYKPCDIVSCMVQIDPHDLNDVELEEIDSDQIFSDGNEDATIRDIVVIGDISALLDPNKVDLSTDANSNSIPDVAEVIAFYAGSGGGDDDFDGAADDVNDEEDKTPNGFNERYLFVINFVITDIFKGASGIGPAVTGALPIRFLIGDTAGNKTRYSAWREELYNPDLNKWRTIGIANWGRDTGLADGVREPVHVGDVFYPDGNSPWGSSLQYIPSPGHAKMPQWSNGHKILENWSMPWRIQIDAAAPSVSRIDQLLLEVPSGGQPVNGALMPVVAGGKSVLLAGNFIYEIGGNGLVTLQASFPSDNDADYVIFMYSDSGISYSSMKGQFTGDVNVPGLYDMLGAWRDLSFPGAAEGLWHDGFNGDDDNDGDADFNDRQVYDATRKPHSDGLDNDADGLVDAWDLNDQNGNADLYIPERDDDEDGIMDEDEYAVKVVNGFARWTFDPVRIARVLKLLPDKAYAIKAVPYDLAGNAKENTASPIYVVFRVIGKDVQEATATATAQIYKDGQPVTSSIRENYTYDLVATTTGTVKAVAFQYSMDKKIWVNMPTASGEPNPDLMSPFGISWRPLSDQLAADLWMDGDNDGVKDPDEPVYQLGDLLFIRAVPLVYGPLLGRYQVVSGLTIVTETFAAYNPEILVFPPVPSSFPIITTAMTDSLAAVLELYPGWNLVSIPLDTENADLESALEPIAGNYKAVWSYDAASESWKRYIPGEPNNNLSTIERGKAYWIDMTDEAVLVMEGTQITNTSVLLHAGLNLAGYNSLREQLTEDAMLSIANDYVCIWTYDSLNKTWLEYSKYTHGFLNNLDQLGPGKGYLIDVEEDCVWTVSP